MTTLSAQFSILDYVLFAIVFVVSLAIGLYCGVKVKGKSTVNEYLFGGKKMNIIPVGFSLAATTITGSATIGQSMEVYAYGPHNWMHLVITPIWSLAIHYIFLNVFYDLQLMSTFTYLEMRFDRSVKNFASALYVISGVFVIPLTIYVPALSFQEVSGINLHIIAVITGLLCIWYTAIGGIKAVVWTDVFQCVLILISAIVIIIVGLSSVGGVEKVFTALQRGERLPIPKTSIDLETRGSVWAYLFSTTFVLLYTFGLSQSAVQRYVSLSTIQNAKKAIWVQASLVEVILLLQLFIGAIIYTAYENCDPLTSGLVKKVDQVFALFVQEKASLFPGFNGIFIAGVFAAGLSTTSTILNSISGTIYLDFLSKRMKSSSEATISRTMKILVAIVGVIGIASICLIEKLGTVFAITIQCFTISTVGVFGLFISGMVFPRTNSKGAKCGVAVSMLVVGFLIIGGLNKTPDPTLPLRVDGCDISNSMNSTAFSNSETVVSRNLNIHWIFRINFQYHCIIGLIINIITGVIISALTGGNKVEDERLLVNFLRKNAPRENLLSVN
ncbi:hypothetical protein DMENIID0001_086960 [Sergentomyia squamirostris]